MKNVWMWIRREGNAAAVAVGIILILFLYIARRTIVPFVAGYYGSSGNNDLIGVLGVLLTFITIVGGGVYYIINKVNKSQFDKILADIGKLTRDELIASRADSEIASSLALMFTHQFLCTDHVYNHVCDQKVCWYGGGEDNNFIKQSISFGRYSLKRVQGINDQEKYLDLILKCKNNLCVALAFQFYPFEKDIEQAQDLSLELYQFAQTKHILESEVPKFVFEATRALVLLRYPAGEQDKKDAGKICRKLFTGEQNKLYPSTSHWTYRIEQLP